MIKAGKVSIIIPVYNVAAYIEECVLSVLCQTYADIEIILVDDCGLDNSINIAKEVLDKHVTFDWKMITHSCNRGLSVARNSGIENSSGEYLFFLDGDDWLDKDCIRKLVNFIEKYDCCVAMGRIHSTNKSVYDSDKCLLLEEKEYITNTVDYYLENRWYPMACNKLVNKQFLLSNNLFFEENIFYEDQLWSFLLACHCKAISVCHDVTYYYRCREGSIVTANKTRKHLDDLIFVMKKISGYAMHHSQLLTNQRVYFHLLMLASISIDMSRQYKLVENKQVFATIKGVLLPVLIASKMPFKQLIINRIRWENRFFYYVLRKMGQYKRVLSQRKRKLID